MQTFRSSARRYALVAGAHRGAYRSIEMLRWVACASSLLRQRDSHSADFPPGRQGSYFCLREKKTFDHGRGIGELCCCVHQVGKGKLMLLRAPTVNFHFPSVDYIYIYVWANSAATLLDELLVYTRLVVNTLWRRQVRACCHGNHQQVQEGQQKLIGLMGWQWKSRWWSAKRLKQQKKQRHPAAWMNTKIYYCITTIYNAAV